jgi:serine protease Do
VDLGDDARRERGLGNQQMALWIKSAGQFGKHAAAKNAGFNKDDVLVALEGKSTRMTEGELLGYLLKNHHAGEKIKVTVLRESQRIELWLPMQ